MADYRDVADQNGCILSLLMQVAEQELHEPQGAYTHFSSKKAPGHKDIVKIVRQAAFMSVYFRSIIIFYIFFFYLGRREDLHMVQFQPLHL